jgi:hypothetical protein
MLGSPRGLCGEDEKGSASATNGFDDALGGAMTDGTTSQFAQVPSTSLSHFETLVSPLDWCIGVIVYKYRKRELPRAGYAMQF